MNGQIKATHRPSGRTVTLWVGQQHHRSPLKTRRAAISWLRSLVLAPAEFGPPRLVRSYEPASNDYHDIDAAFDPLKVGK